MEMHGKVKNRHVGYKVQYKAPDLFKASFWCAAGAYCGWTTFKHFDYSLGRWLYERDRRKEASHAEN